MYPIFLPINPNSKGNEVTNLQECLLFLLDSKIFIAYQPPNRPGQEELNQWRKMLLEEKALSLFGEGTRQLVFNFQVQQGLGDNLRGVVEETTAVKMNELLKSLGAFREYIVYGTVVNSDSSPAQGLTVNAFDKDLAGEDLLGESITNADGAYRITYSEEQFRRSTSERGGPDLFVRVLTKDGKNLFQSNTVLNAPPEQRLDVMLPSVTFVVRGTVREANGKPARNTIVRAYDQDLRKNQLLGKAATDSEGQYKISYNSLKFQRAEKTSADLFVVVVNAKGKELVSSGVFFNAPVEAIIDLTLLTNGKTLSEFELLLEAILPLLIGQGKGNTDLKITELEEKDIVFLSKETGQPGERIGFLLAAVKANLETGETGLPLIGTHVAPSVAGTIPVEAFYGWFRQGLPGNLSGLRQQTPGALRKSLLSAIRELIVPFIDTKQVDVYISLLGNSQWEEVRELIQAAGFSSAEQVVLSNHFDNLDAVQDVALTGLMQAGVLTDSQADLLGLAASIQRLIQAPVNMLGTLLETVPPKLARPLVRSEDLARLHPQDWQSLIKAAGITPPDGQSIEEFAQELEEVAVNTYPTVGLMHRAARVPELLEDHFRAIQPQTETLKKIWALTVNDPDLSDLVDKLPSDQQEAIAEIQNFVRSHPGIDTDLPFGKLQEAASIWVGQLNEFIKANEDQDLLAKDFSALADKPVRLNFGSLPREPILRELKALQRMLAVAENATYAQVLMRAGFYSSTQVALLTRETVMEKTGLDYAEVEVLRGRALEQSGQVATAYFAILDAVQTKNMVTGAADIGKIQELDVLRKLFGNMDACECAHCLSVLSPAAYFVDLMYYIERFISQPEETKRALSVRRPDLWALPLSCENTNTIVPALDIVNRVLEGWLKQKLNVGSSVAVFNEIATRAATSFNLPVNFPLQRLEILLAHFGLSRDRVAQALGWAATERVRTRLQLTYQEAELISTPKTVDPSAAALYFEQLYATSLSHIDVDAVLASDYDLSQLQRITKTDRNVLRELVLSRFISTDGSTNPSITMKLVASTGSVQNDYEMIRGLSVRRLDRLHRLLRLWRVLPWTVGEIDYVLMRLSARQSLAPAEITADVLGDIVSLLDLADRTRLPLDELMSLTGAIPDIGLHGDDSLFNRRFNTQPFVVRDGIWPADLPAQLKHPAFGPDEGISAPDKNTLTRLLAALQIDNSQFLDLVNGLASASVAANETLKKQVNTGRYVIQLTSVSLQLLYRHARLARLLGVKVSVLLRLMALTPELNSKASNRQFVESMSDLLASLRFADAQQASGYKLEQIDWLLNPANVPALTRAAQEIATSVVQTIAQERRLIIASKTLTTIGLTEDESTQAIQKLNETILEPFGSTDEYRFQSGVAISDIEPQVLSKLSATLDFDVAETAILSLTRHLGEFEDTALSAPLYIDDVSSRQIVADNLVSVAKPQNAFLRIREEDLTAIPVQRARYRINPIFDQTLPEGRLQNIATGLSDKIVRECLKAMYAAGNTKVLPETLFQKIFLSEQQSRWLAAANMAESPEQSQPLIKSPSADGVLLNPIFFAAGSAPTLVLNKLLTKQINTLLGRYHWQLVFDEVVGSELGIQAGKVTEFRSYDFPLNTNAIIQALLGVATDLLPLTQWIVQVQRLQCLLQNPIFDIAACHLVLASWPRVTALPTRQILWNQILSVSAYARWLKAVGNVMPEAAVRRMAIEHLLQTSVTQDLAEQYIAEALAVPVDDIRSARPVTPAHGQWFKRLDQWALILEITSRLGVSGETLSRMRPKTISETVGTSTVTVEDIGSLWRAADDIHAAFRTKYFDEAIFNEKSEAFEDLTRSKQRDALVAFLVSEYAFQGPSQLYAHFLLDVEVSGCARTSELVSATTSLQLYVHRVLMGLEISDSQGYVQFNSEDARKEWIWRKHYRVWEANRKVFLYPENFIEPDLRDDKTPLFRDLESELLQRQISTGEAEESYAKYLSGYNELADLKVVGAFHDVETDVLHLVGVTESDPPIHYLRQVNNMTMSESMVSKPLHFGPWEKLNVQMPVKWVAPVIYQRKLMLFWTEITTVPGNRKIDNENYFDGYEHSFKVKWIERKPDASWSAPQEIYFLDGESRRKSQYADPLVIYWEPATIAGNYVPFPLFLTDYRAAFRGLEKNTTEGHIPIGIQIEHYKAEPKSVGLDRTGWFLAGLPDKIEDYRSVHHHGAPIDAHTLTGWNWERAFPTVRFIGSGASVTETLQIAAMNSDVHGFMPISERRIPFVSYADIEAGRNNLAAAHGMYSFFFNGNQLRRSSDNRIWPVGHHVVYSTNYLLTEKSDDTKVTIFNANISDGLVVNSRACVSEPGSSVDAFRASAVLHAGTFQVLAISAAQPRLIALSSSLAQPILKQLAAKGLPGLLNLKFENDLNEAEPLQDKLIGAKFGSGAFGTYSRETFFHIPFLIANHLNSQQRFAESQQWYHYIFNPMNSANPWQYREFNGLAVESMRKMLTDPAALAAYRSDPFNPHAIARTRLSAYQKSIGMKYIDNLLDWGDKLFSQFTMESLNEAMMLYVLASDILGQRPAQLPRCADEKSRTYAQIKPSLSAVSDFLIEEIEQIIINPDRHKGIMKSIQSADSPIRHTRFRAASSSAISYAATMNDAGAFADKSGGYSNSGGGTVWTSTTGTPLSGLQLGNKEINTELNSIGPSSTRLIGGNIDFLPGETPMTTGLFNKVPEINVPGLNLTGTKLEQLDIKYTLNDVPPPHRDVFYDQPPKYEPIELVSARSVFCFPQNEELLAYWTRVEDRLFKVRNCMDIDGVRRRLDLFAPEIDPHLLVRMKAAGLSLEDVLDITTGHAPPYRFAFLLEKARQYASTVQSLGGQVLSALEKRDAEELAAMRSVHEQQLLEMRTQLMRWEIDASNDALEVLNKQKEAAGYRKEHYEGLISGGLSGWELAQSAATISATSFSSLSAAYDIAASIAGFIPQVHTPTITGATAETGGRSVSEGLARLSSSFKTMAGIADRIGGLAGLEGGFQRRAEEWEHQAKLAAHELQQINKQIEAAEIRVLISERSLESQEKSIEQAKEVYDFYRNKFSNLGLYTWMSTQLNRMHRLAFNTAWSMARMAEKALHFERPDLRDSVNLGATAWDAGRAGLLAGENLLLELQRMEMRHLETNYRELEVEQTFSLAQFSADQLIELRTKGECEFSIPEFFFDLHYPGQYRRRIKAVRLTLPCLIGPYGNVGATLTMIRSELRDRPQANDALKSVPLRHAPTIAASSAQNDAGVFEFSFRDERYMPFEGMGAISTWKLSLPMTVQSFDYRTISDVILRINYTALYDSDLRDNIEQDELYVQFQAAMPVRIFSLRHDFPTAWSQFMNSMPNTSQRCELKISLKAEHFPYWASSFIGRGTLETSVLVDSSVLDDSLPPDTISIYKLGTLPSSSLEPEVLDNVKKPGPDQVYYGGVLAATQPVTAYGDWKVWFKSLDRDKMRDLWLVMHF